MKRNILIISGVLLWVLLFQACSKSSDGPSITAIAFKVPDNFPPPVYQFVDNEVSNNRFQLGRKLFYDPRLSLDNTISCGSCHLQSAAFSHVDHKVSHGIYGLLGTRNAPAIFNMAWQTNFFWDGGVNHMEVQHIGQIQNPVEMDMNLGALITKLQNTSDYPGLFKTAYGSDSITSQKMLKALAQFMALMISSNSKYDKYIRGEAGITFTQSELNGLNLYRQKCSSCHSEPLFTDLSYRNNGLDSVFTDDEGRAKITFDSNDLGKFKVPSLRNVAVSYPYMHNGKIRSLEKVLDHYSSGIVSSPTLDPLLTNGIPLSADEKADLISFLETLTDYTFVSDHRFMDPN